MLTLITFVIIIAYEVYLQKLNSVDLPKYALFKNCIADTNLHPWMNLFALRLKGVEIKTIIIWVLRDSEHPTTVPYDKLFEQLARNLSALSCIMHTSLTLSPLARD